MKKLYLAALFIGWLLAALLFGPAHGAPDPEKPLNVPRETPTPVIRHMAVMRAYTEAQLAVKAEIASLFPDQPRMVAVLACESHYAQLCGPEVDGIGTCDPSRYGDPLLSPTHDVGVAQINLPTWGKEAAALGLNIASSTADNLAMARVIYEKQGIGAWVCSAKV